MKRLIATALATIMLITLCSCSMIRELSENVLRVLDITSETLVPYMQVQPRELTYNEGYTPVESRYSYNALPNDGERELYDKLTEAYYNISADPENDYGLYPMSEIKLDGLSLSEAEVRTAMKAVTDDRPEIFWPSGTVGYYSDEDTTIVRAYSRYSPEEVDNRVESVRAVADEFYASVPDGLSEYEREKLVHDYLLERTDYDTEVDKVNFESNHPDIYTAYGALVQRKAVCEGYARAFQMLLNGLGVDCVGVLGTGDDEMHIWNCVRLDDSWYNADVTWDDQEEPYAQYLYFNVTDDYLSSDHIPSPMWYDLSDSEINGDTGEINADVMNLFIPECSDPYMSYYYRELPHLDSYEGEEVKSALLSAAEDRAEYFLFYIDEEIDFDEAIALLFAEQPQYFFDYCSVVNYYLPDYSIDNSNISYYPIDKCRSVAVVLNYY